MMNFMLLRSTSTCSLLALLLLCGCGGSTGDPDSRGGAGLLGMGGFGAGTNAMGGTMATAGTAAGGTGGHGGMGIGGMGAAGMGGSMCPVPDDVTDGAACLECLSAACCDECEAASATEDPESGLRGTCVNEALACVTVCFTREVNAGYSDDYWEMAAFCHDECNDASDGSFPDGQSPDAQLLHCAIGRDEPGTVLDGDDAGTDASGAAQCLEECFPAWQ